MKTLLLFFLSLTFTGLLSAQSTGGSSSSTATAIEIDFFGSGTDCALRGRRCLAVEMADAQGNPSGRADAIGTLYYDNQNRLVMELSQVFDRDLWVELENGILTVASQTTIPATALPGATENSTDFLLRTGVYSSFKLHNGHYMVIL